MAACNVNGEGGGVFGSCDSYTLPHCSWCETGYFANHLARKSVNWFSRRATERPAKQIRYTVQGYWRK